MGFRVWVVAKRDDPSLAPLSELEGAVDFVYGTSADDFKGALAPNAMLLASGAKPLFRALFELAPHVEWIHARFAGVDHVLFSELISSPTVVTNGRGAFAPALAEFVMGALLFFAKDFRRMLDAQRRGEWEPFQPDALAGQTLGIVGYGAIGAATAPMARALGMRVIASRRNVARSSDDGNVDEILPATALVDLVKKSDHLMVATPLTRETHHLIDAGVFSAMRAHGIFINVGRGPVVDESALSSALDQGRIRGAALDVFEVEPLPSGHPLYRNERVLLSPHTADRTPGWLERATMVFVDNVKRKLRGEPLVNVVDKTLGY